MNLRDAVVLITGGTRGLGLVLARELGLRGATIAACARDEREVETATADLAARGIQAFAATCDVTDRRQVADFVAAVEARYGRIDVLVNDAGTILVGPMDRIAIEDYRSVMATNFFGPLHMMYAVLPGMRRRRAGSIVNIASVGGVIPVPHLAPYVASKFALAGFSQTARAELAKDGIRVTTINPGLMRTGSPENATFVGAPAIEYAWFTISGLAAIPNDERRGSGRADRARARNGQRLGSARPPRARGGARVRSVSVRRRRTALVRCRVAPRTAKRGPGSRAWPRDRDAGCGVGAHAQHRRRGGRQQRAIRAAAGERSSGLALLLSRILRARYDAPRLGRPRRSFDEDASAGTPRDVSFGFSRSHARRLPSSAQKRFGCGSAVHLDDRVVEVGIP